MQQGEKDFVKVKIIYKTIMLLLCSQDCQRGSEGAGGGVYDIAAS